MVRKLTVLTTVATLGFALMVPATAFAGGGPSPTGKSTTTVNIGGRALLTTPNEIFVKLTYSCFPAPFGFGSFGNVTVSQVLPGTGGSSSFTPVCDDNNQTQYIPVFGNFTPGDAAASAFVGGFDFAFATQEIKIVAS